MVIADSPLLFFFPFDSFSSSSTLSSVEMRRMTAFFFTLAAARIGGCNAFVAKSIPRNLHIGSVKGLWGTTSSISRFSVASGGNEVQDVEAKLSELSRLEIRVGRIVEVTKHPTLNKIFVEKIDLGEEEPRTICSGLQDYMSEGDLLDKDCIVVCNLKPRDLEGVPSNGMVLCASNQDHSEVKLVSAPDGCAPGELVTFRGHLADPSPTGNRAVKAWKKVSNSFETDANGNAMFTGEPPALFHTSLGPCTSSIINGLVS